MLRFMVSILAGGCWLVATGATGSIGVIRSSGDFRVDGSTLRGNGTVFDGNVIETTVARSVVHLDAVEITLGPDSRARVYRDRTVLEKGAGLLRDADKHVFEAASLRISPAARDSVIQVDVEGPGRINVSTRGGGAQVRNSAGVLVASMRPWSELAFDAGAGAAAGASTSVHLSGVLTVQGGKYFIADATTGIKVELQGSDLGKYVGTRVNIYGSAIPGATPAAGASQVVQVTSVVPAAAGVAGGAAAASSAGLSTAATAAIIGGIGVAATVGGLAAVGDLPGQSSPTTSTK